MHIHMYISFVHAYTIPLHVCLYIHVYLHVCTCLFNFLTLMKGHVPQKAQGIQTYETTMFSLCTTNYISMARDSTTIFLNCHLHTSAVTPTNIDLHALGAPTW